VTGVDISDEAIGYAQRLSAESGIAGEFVRSDVYDFLDEAAAAGRTWDVAFMSYGAYIWLSDLPRYMRGVARLLAPGGQLVLIEFHPAIQTLDEKWAADGPYFGGSAPLSGSGIQDYVADSGEGLVPWGKSAGVTAFVNPHGCHQFNHALAEVVTAVLEAGLTLESLREYPYSNGCKLFDDMIELPGRRFVPPPGRPQLPQMFSLTARRAR
jgi:SAM-dependent methyltransferase